MYLKHLVMRGRDGDKFKLLFNGLHRVIDNVHDVVVGFRPVSGRIHEESAR